MYIIVHGDSISVIFYHILYVYIYLCIWCICVYTRYWWDETCVRQRVVPSAGKLRTHVGSCEIRLKLILLHAAQINKTQNNGQVVGKVTTLRYPHGNLHLHASTIIINHLHTIYNHLKAPQCQCSATSQFLANQFASRVVRFHTWLTWPFTGIRIILYAFFISCKLL